MILWKARPLERPLHYIGRLPGRVVRVSKEEGFIDVLTGDGILRVFEVQGEENSKKNASEEITSVRVRLGLNVGELLEQMEALKQEIEKFKKVCLS